MNLIQSKDFPFELTPKEREQIIQQRKQEDQKTTQKIENQDTEYVDNYDNLKTLAKSLQYDDKKKWEHKSTTTWDFVYTCQISTKARQAYDDYKKHHDNPELMRIEQEYIESKKSRNKKWDERNEKRAKMKDIIAVYNVEDAAIEDELKLMADNQILLLQNERCPFLTMAMSGRDMENRFAMPEDKDGNIVFTKKIEEFKSDHFFNISDPILVYGFPEPLTVKNTEKVLSFKNALADAMSRGCAVQKFGMKPKLFETDRQKKTKTIFTHVYDGEEIVIGDENVWKTMNEKEKQAARLRGKVLSRSGALGGFNDSTIKEYMKNVFTLEQRDELREFYYEQYLANDKEKIFVDRKDGTPLYEKKLQYGENWKPETPIKITNSNDYWNKVVMTGYSKYAFKTIFGHIWTTLVTKYNVDVLMSETNDFVGMDEFAARLLNRMDADGEIKETYGFVVEKKGLELRANSFDYKRCETLLSNIHKGEIEKREYEAEKLPEYKKELEKMVQEGEVSPKYVDKQVLKQIIKDIRESDKDDRFLYHYWVTFMSYYAQQLQDIVYDNGGGSKQWNAGMNDRTGKRKIRSANGFSGHWQTFAGEHDNLRNRANREERLYGRVFHIECDPATSEDVEICLECAIQAINVNASNADPVTKQRLSEILKKLFDEETPTTKDYEFMYGWKIEFWKDIINQTECLNDNENIHKLVDWMNNQERPKARGSALTDVFKVDTNILLALEEVWKDRNPKQSSP